MEIGDYSKLTFYLTNGTTRDEYFKMVKRDENDNEGKYKKLLVDKISF